MRQARLAGGRILQFPDETTDDVIDSTVQREMGLSGKTEAPEEAAPSFMRDVALKTGKDVGMELIAGAEATMALSGQIVLWPFAKAYGLMAWPAGVSKQAEADILGLGYQPYTERGREALEVASKPFRMLFAPAQKAQEQWEELGYPRVGYLTGLGAEAGTIGATMGLGRAVPAARGAIKGKPRLPTRQEVALDATYAKDLVQQRMAQERVRSRPLEILEQREARIKGEPLIGESAKIMDEVLGKEGLYRMREERPFEEAAAIERPERFFEPGGIDVEAPLRKATEAVGGRPPIKERGIELQQDARTGEYGVKITDRTIPEPKKTIAEAQVNAVLRRGGTAQDAAVTFENFLRQNQMLQGREGLLRDLYQGDTLRRAADVVARNAKNIAKDVNTVIGERGAVGLKNLTPEQTAAFNRLKNDLAVIKRNAKKVGKTIEKYLEDLGIGDADIRQKLMVIAKKVQEVPEAKKTPTIITEGKAGTPESVLAHTQEVVNRILAPKTEAEGLPIDVTLKEARYAWEGIDHESVVRARNYQNVLHGAIKNIAKDMGVDPKALGDAITLFREDRGKNQLAKADVPKEYQKQVQLAKELKKGMTRELQGLIDEIDDFHQGQWRIANQGQLINGWVENYAIHKWQGKGRKGSPYSMSPIPDQAKMRKISTYQKGLEEGMIPKSLNAADLIRVSHESLMRAVGVRNYLNDVKSLKHVDGKPALRPATEIPEGEIGDWAPVESPFLKGYTFRGIGKPGAKKTTVLVDKRLYLPKDLADITNKLLDPTTFFQKNKYARAVNLYNSWVKAKIFTVALFHHINILKEATINLQHPLKYREGLRKLRAEDPAVISLIRDGGLNPMVGVIPEFEAGLVRASYEGRLGKIPGVKQFAQFEGWWNRKLFEDFVGGHKIVTGLKVAEQLTKKHPELTSKEVSRIAGQFANDVYGGQSWKAMGFSNNQVAWLRNTLLAPDWTISNVKMIMGTAGPRAQVHPYRMYWLKNIAFSMGAIELAQQALTGDSAVGNWLEGKQGLGILRVDLGKVTGGRLRGKVDINLWVGTLHDASNIAKLKMKMLYHKAAPFLSQLIQQTFAKDVLDRPFPTPGELAKGEFHGKPYARPPEGLMSIPGRALNIAKQPVPIPAQQLPAIVRGTDAERAAGALRGVGVAAYPTYKRKKRTRFTKRETPLQTMMYRRLMD